MSDVITQVQAIIEILGYEGMSEALEIRKKALANQTQETFRKKTQTLLYGEPITIEIIFDGKRIK